MAPRALIVDDEEPIRALLSAIIAQQGFAVDTASDGEEAIAKIAENPDYHVILLDLMMPRVNGFDVLGYVDAAKPELVRRIIIATAVPEREVRRQITQPVFKVHFKPFELPRLIADLRLCASS